MNWSTKSLVGALIAIIAALPTSSPAGAAGEGVIELSPDGVVFSHELSGLLEGAVLVPRGSATDTLYIRNTSENDGYLRIGLSNTAPTKPGLSEVLALELRSAERTWGPTALIEADPCVEVVHNLALPAGDTARIDARVLLSDLVSTDLQSESITFSLDILMTSSPGVPSQDGCFAATSAPPLKGSPPALGTTGAGVPLIATAAAIGLLAAGSAVLLSRRRRGPNNGQ